MAWSLVAKMEYVVVEMVEKVVVDMGYLVEKKRKKKVVWWCCGCWNGGGDGGERGGGVGGEVGGEGGRPRGRHGSKPWKWAAGAFSGKRRKGKG